MNPQQVLQPRASSNGYARRRVDKDMGPRTENITNGGKITAVGSPSRDRLIYVLAHLIGHHVEVHVRGGSIISGIFHATDAENDFGIVLKMAQLIKDGSVRVQKHVPDTTKRPQTMIIPAKELVQVLAKDMSFGDEFTNGHAREKRKEFMIDSAISHANHLEVERELERWIPDQNDAELPELDNIFDGTWNRSWDQFETNETLFGVKSTFDEELYTTRLEKGPHMRDREREASRIARLIEGEETHDQHLAEERGTFLDDLDEESRYSAVHRDVSDGRVEELDNSFSDDCSTETFGGSLNCAIPESHPDITRKNITDEAQPSSTYSSGDSKASSLNLVDKHVNPSGSFDHVSRLTVDRVSKPLSLGDESRFDEKQTRNQCDKESLLNEYTERIVSEEAQTSISEATEPGTTLKVLSASATAYDPFGVENKHSSSGYSESATPVKISALNEPAKSLRPGTSTSPTCERAGALSSSSVPGLSPSSSVGSLSSEKSTLNPYAKEFKFNPNAKSFTPSTSVRAQSPVSENSFYYPGNMPGVPHMHNLPVGVGFGPSFRGQQPVYNPQNGQLQSPQAYIPSNGPLYGQQMMLGQPRPVYYMQTYQPEMPFKGREF